MEQSFIGFVTDVGGATSHTAILARSLAIPAVLGGDHASPFGLIAELSLRHPGMGILQVDALLAIDAQLVAIDLAVHLQLAFLQLRRDLLGEAVGEHFQRDLRAGVAGGGTAALAGWAVMVFVMEADYSFEPVSAFAIVLGGILATMAAGLLFALRPLAARPAQVLRSQE